jgi:mannose-6-phosphate isomerase-like protein (cupin superfamily)
MRYNLFMGNQVGKFIGGKVSDYTKRSGWFFGHFADNDLLKSDLVEVSWQNISNKRASAKDKHLHTSSVEINIVIAGEVSLTINGRDFIFRRGDFWVIWPQTLVENVRAGKDTELIVLRAPSVNDKKII